MVPAMTCPCAPKNPSLPQTNILQLFEVELNGRKNLKINRPLLKICLLFILYIGALSHQHGNSDRWFFMEVLINYQHVISQSIYIIQSMDLD